jgi:hypothetical protein
MHSEPLPPEPADGGEFEVSADDDEVAHRFGTGAEDFDEPALAPDIRVIPDPEPDPFAADMGGFGAESAYAVVDEPILAEADAAFDEGMESYSEIDQQAFEPEPVVAADQAFDDLAE